MGKSVLNHLRMRRRACPRLDRGGVADGAHDGVDLVAVAALEEVSPKMAIGLAIADDGFDGGPEPEFSSDLAVDAALLPGTIDPVRLRRIVADIALVHINALDFPAGQ